MASKRVDPPSKIPQVPKRNPSRPTLTSQPLRKRQPEPPSLRHDKRVDQVDSQDNDRKRRAKIYFEDSFFSKEDGGQTRVNSNGKQVVDDGYEADSDCEGQVAGSPIVALGRKGLGGFYEPSQQADSAVDLSSGTKYAIEDLGDLSVHDGLRPRPLTFRPKLTIEVVHKTSGKPILEVSWKALSNSSKKTVSKDAASLEPAGKPSIPYTDSEYSDDVHGNSVGAKDPDSGLEIEDPSTYNHNIDAYLNDRAFTVKSKDSKLQLDTHSSLGPSDQPHKEKAVINNSDIDSLDSINGYKVTFENSNGSTADVGEADDESKNSFVWLEVETRTRAFDKVCKVQLQCRSRISRSSEPHGQWLVDMKLDFTNENETIAFSKGAIVQRSLIKSNFLEVINNVDQTVSKIPSHLFNRYGCLRRELKCHEVRRGTGIWQDEIDRGDICIIEIVYMDKGWCHVNLGKLMVRSIMEKARACGSMPAFILIDPSFSTQSLEDSMNTEDNFRLKSEEDTKYRYSIIHVLRSLGFRRIGISTCFGYAINPTHASHSMNEDQDRVWDFKIGNRGHQFNVSGDMAADKFFFGGLQEDTRLQRLSRTHSIHWATMTLSEPECIRLYEETTRNFEFNKRDKLFRNVLHVAASEQKSQCVLWLLQNVKRIADLRSARNLAGYTPLEGLEAKLEALRNAAIKFTGFDLNAVVCLAALRNSDELDDIDRQRMRFGCTCGGCVEGFMSPRTQFALTCKSTKIYHLLSRSKSVEYGWMEENADVLEFVNPEVQVNLALSPHLRRGYMNLFFHIAEVLESQLIPNTASVKENAWGMRDNKPQVAGCLFENGTTEAAIQIVFEMARDSDEWAGNGDHQEEFKVEHEALPKCRNDHEWELVARMCGLREMATRERL